MQATADTTGTNVSITSVVTREVDSLISSAVTREVDTPTSSAVTREVDSPSNSLVTIDVDAPTSSAVIEVDAPTSSAVTREVDAPSNSTVTTEVDALSKSAEAIPQPYVNSNLTSTAMSESTPPSADACKEEEACVSSQQMGSSSSDENEDDNSWDPDECDNGSEISEFSDFSQESWQPVQGPIAWVQEQMRRGQSPRKILEDLVPSGTVIPEGLDPIMLWKIIINIVSEPPKRKKLNDINTLDDVLRLLNASKKIIVLTGAGVSVSCGIPDFRSRGGVYARLAKDFPNLPDPQAMFDIHFFRNDPRPFFKFAREIYPGQFKPSPCHRFIHMLEEKGKLLRNYTQNIDTLEQVAGIQRVVQCHGSFATATCTVCGHKVDSNAIKEDIFNQVIPHCPSCSPSDQDAVMKPDIVFFGESLPEHFHNQMAADKDECDLLIVIGSSLKVRPVALIPNSLPASIPQILINRERLHYLNFDVELLGNCDEIIGELCRRLGPGWEELAAAGPPINEVLMSSLLTPPASPHSVESRDRWHRAGNPTVSSSEAAAVVCSKNILDTLSVSQECPGHPVLTETSENCMTSAPAFPTLEDDAQEVSTSQSEPKLTNMQKTHHHHHHHPHRHSLKRPLSEITTTDASSDQEVLNPAGSDQAIFCSAKEVETLVSACHKKDVMFIPTDKSLEHHGFHSQQSYDRAKSYAHHHNQSSIHERSESPSIKHNHPSPQTYNDNGHNLNLVPSESSKDVAINHETCTGQVHQESQVEALPKCVQSSPACSKSSAAAHLQEKDADEGCPKRKKPRLISKGCQEDDSNEAAVEAIDDTVGHAVAESSLCDSLSQDESLDNIRKMWHSRCRVSLAQRLEGNQVLFLPPSRYVFKGAEVFSGSESDDSDDSDDDSSDEDESSVNNDADKLSEDVLMSENPDAEKDLDSSESASEEKRSNQQKLLPSSSAGDKLAVNMIHLPAQNTLVTQSEGGTDFDREDMSVQDSECRPSSDISYPQSECRPSSDIPYPQSECRPSSDVSYPQSECRPSSDISYPQSECKPSSDVPYPQSECRPSSDAPYPQSKLSDSSATCPVSSTEDFYLGQTAQISNRLHSLQDQRD